MAAKIIPVFAVSDATLTSSTVPENDHSAWDTGTSYANTVRVIKGHKIWESVQASNVGHDPEADDGTWWSEYLATNRWKVFDSYIQDQAEQAESAEWVVTPGETINSVSLFGLYAASVTITVTDPTDGVVYDKTFDLTDNSGVIDGYTYFFSPIVLKSELCVTELPPYSGAAIRVLVSNPGGTAKVGQICLGYAEELGITVDQLPLGIEDYTRLNTDDFGRTSPAQRSYARTARPMIMVDTYRIPYLETRIAERRGIATVWAFDTAQGDNYLVYLGFFTSMTPIFQYAGKSTLDLEIRSLV